MVIAACETPFPSYSPTSLTTSLPSPPHSLYTFTCSLTYIHSSIPSSSQYVSFPYLTFIYIPSSTSSLPFISQSFHFIPTSHTSLPSLQLIPSIPYYHYSLRVHTAFSYYTYHPHSLHISMSLYVTIFIPAYIYTLELVLLTSLHFMESCISARFHEYQFMESYRFARFNVTESCISERFHE